MWVANQSLTCGRVSSLLPCLLFTSFNLQRQTAHFTYSNNIFSPWCIITAQINSLIYTLYPFLPLTNDSFENQIPTQTHWVSYGAHWSFPDAYEPRPCHLASTTCGLKINTTVRVTPSSPPHFSCNFGAQFAGDRSCGCFSGKLRRLGSSCEIRCLRLFLWEIDRLRGFSGLSLPLDCEQCRPPETYKRRASFGRVGILAALRCQLLSIFSTVFCLLFCYYPISSTQHCWIQSH